MVFSRVTGSRHGHDRMQQGELAMLQCGWWMMIDDDKLS